MKALSKLTFRQLLYLGIARGKIRIVMGFWSLYYRVVLAWHPAVKCCGRLRISGPVRWCLDPRGELTLGNVRLNSGVLVNPVGGDRPTIIAVGKNGRLWIGNKAGISGSTISCHAAITIEEYVLIGGGCLIIDTDFHPLNLSTRFEKTASQVHSRPVKIGRGAFVGAQSIILKGVTIGAGAVVGAGSVVSRDIPEWEIWAGNPARFIRKVKDVA